LTISNGVRALLWRFGRKVYCLARGDLPNRPETNGEYWLLDQFLATCDTDSVFIDVGANQGDWTLRALDVAARGSASLKVYAFEPSTATRAILTRRLAARDSVKINANALSSAEGEVYFYSNENGSGTNSLSEVSGNQRELVRMITLDSFLAEGGIRHIGMLKIDTEGFDFAVLKGGERALAAGLIELVQFEYNWRWLINHVALRDVFTFIKDKPYRIGKLVGNSIELFDEWHFEMDRYFENNYVLLREGSSMLNIVNPVRFDESNCARRIGKPSNT
jgi:FkbM family methyltransferase